MYCEPLTIDAGTFDRRTSIGLNLSGALLLRREPFRMKSILLVAFLKPLAFRVDRHSRPRADLRVIRSQRRQGGLSRQDTFRYQAPQTNVVASRNPNKWCNSPVLLVPCATKPCLSHCFRRRLCWRRYSHSLRIADNRLPCHEVRQRRGCYLTRC